MGAVSGDIRWGSQKGKVIYRERTKKLGEEKRKRKVKRARIWGHHDSNSHPITYQGYSRATSSCCYQVGVLIFFKACEGKGKASEIGVTLSRKKLAKGKFWHENGLYCKEHS